MALQVSDTRFDISSEVFVQGTVSDFLVNKDGSYYGIKFEGVNGIVTVPIEKVTDRPIGEPTITDSFDIYKLGYKKALKELVKRLAGTENETFSKEFLLGVIESNIETGPF